MRVRVIDISSGLELLVGSLSSLLVSLFLGQLCVSILDRLLHISACSCMLRLGLLEQVVKVLGLSIESRVSKSLLILEQFLLALLLLNPVLLL